MKDFLEERGMALLVGLLSLLIVLGVFWFALRDGAPDGASHDRARDGSMLVNVFETPATSRLGTDLSEALEVLQALQSGEGVTTASCERCRFLSQAADVYKVKAVGLLETIRVLESSISASRDGLMDAERNGLVRNLALQQKSAGRVIAGLMSFADAIAKCEEERLCRRDDPSRAAETMPLDCARDQPDLQNSVARIERLAEKVIDEARQCQRFSCPIMHCGRAAGLADDLSIVETSLAELAGGRLALPGASDLAPAAGLATVLGSVERGLVALAIQSAETSLDPDALTARADDMKAGLGSWLQETESRHGVQETSWRVSALMGEIDVAAEWARAGESVEHTRAYFQSLSRAVLSAARLDAALALSEETAGEKAASNGPVCGANELGRAYLKVGQARAALNFCRAKSACPIDGADEGMPYRSASSQSLGAYAAVTGALPLDDKRIADAGVAQSAPVDLSLEHQRYRAGEVVRVRADTRASSCLMEDGAVALVRAGSPARRAQRYLLEGGAVSEILLSAPTTPGRYAVRVFASADRGGGALRDQVITVDAFPVGCDGFSGLWDTDFGRLYLTEREGEVTGSYRRNDTTPLPGLFVGKRRGSVVEGTWLSELGRGGAKMRLTDGGNRFVGSWGVTADRVDGGGQWNGACLGYRH
ncbi:MAG: hypothetical protein RLN89_00175 [Parvibaculum sp.]